MINKAVIREYKVMNVLMICWKLKSLWHFEILTWEINGENPEMCNILKTADQREKRGKFWGCSLMYCICTVLFMSESLSSVWGHSVHFAKFLILKLSKGYCSHTFHSI